MEGLELQAQDARHVRDQRIRQAEQARIVRAVTCSQPSWAFRLRQSIGARLVATGQWLQAPPSQLHDVHEW